jgi:type I restriction enzyme S subunit
MKTYSEYKDSGVQWIGKVPSHWNPCRFKNFISLINTPSKDDNKIGLENIESGTGHFKETDSEFEGNGVQFVEDDIVYGKLRPYLRKVWLATNKGNAVGDFFVFRANKSNPSYIYWLMLSDGFTSEANGSTYGAKMPRVSSDFILSMRFVLPPFPEQQAIASFLDVKTKPIDDIIAKREKQIELLEEMKSAIISRAVTKGLNPKAKMKDSGIEWIGEVPEEWEISKVKYIANVCGRIGYRGYTTNDLVSAGEGALTIGGKHITHNYLNLSDPDYISWEKYYESPEIMLEKGDIVMAQRGSLGKSALIDREIGEATINPSLVILKRIKANRIFLHYYLISNMMQDYINLINTATAVPMISQNQIENIPVALPPLSEQQAIASYLDSETSKIDSRIAKRRRQIELLQEYKQALITAAVTGKIDVRELNS